MADVDINMFFPVFAQSHVPVAFLVPTQTGYEKSIMDAIGTVREMHLQARRCKASSYANVGILYERSYRTYPHNDIKTACRKNLPTW